MPQDWIIESPVAGSPNGVVRELSPRKAFEGADALAREPGSGALKLPKSPPPHSTGAAAHISCRHNLHRRIRLLFCIQVFYVYPIAVLLRFLNLPTNFVTASVSARSHSEQPTRRSWLTPPLAGSPCAARPRSPAAIPALLGCRSLMGLNAEQRNTVVWRHDTGLFAYAADNVVVLEDLDTHQQRYLQHHTQPVGTLHLGLRLSRLHWVLCSSHLTC